MELKGYGLLQPGDRQRTLTNTEIGSKNLSFMVLRDRWKYINPRKDFIDFDRLKTQIERCHKFNKGYIPAIMTGQGCTPDWLPGKRLNWVHDRRKYVNVLAPWLPIIWQQYEAVLQKLADLVDNDPLNLGVWVNGPTVASQEMHTNGVDKQPGYSNIAMADNWRSTSVIFNNIFKKSNLIYSITGQNAAGYLPSVINYAKTLSPKDRLYFQHNSLGTQTSLGANHHKLLLSLHKEGYRVGAEMVGPGETAAISRFPESNYIILYPNDQSKKLPNK